MALVGQYQQSSFVTPSIGQTPIASGSVRANDNALAAVLNAHDADATIHVQTGTLANRPAAGTVGQMYLVTSGASIGELYYDDGAWQLVEDFVAVLKGGSAVGLRPTLNFVEGSNITITAADDPGNNRVNLTIAAAGGGGGPPQAHNTSHQDGGSDEISVTGLSGLLADAQKVTVAKAGSDVGTRAKINLIEGTNVTMTVADNAGAGRVDVTINSSGGGGGPPSAHASSHQDGGSDEISVTGLSGLLNDAQKSTIQKAAAGGGTRPTINFIEGSNITLTVSDNAGSNRVDVTIAAAGSALSGSGTSGTIAKWTGTTQLGNSLITDNGTTVTVTGPLVASSTLSVTGKTSTAATASGGAGLVLPHGTAPSSPANGDLWTTTAGLYVRINGTTVGPLAAGVLTGSGTANKVAKFSGSTALTNSIIDDDGTTVNVNGNITRDRGSFTADSGDYKVGGVIISTSNPSGTAPTGCLWLKY